MYKFNIKLVCLSLVSFFQLSLMFVIKARAYPRVKCFILHLGWLLALPTNIRLGLKSLPGTNIVAD